MILFRIFRFGNIHPYDFNRVKLINKIGGMDYINASHITGEKSTNPDNLGSIDIMDDDVKDDKDNPARFSNINFIACQGPLPNTLTHHLQMLHENKVDIVVMLTRCKEKDKSKFGEKCWAFKPSLLF